MGLLVEGRWQDVWYPTKSTGGRFVRKDAAFRNWITVDGSAGPTGIGGFTSEAGRYHLYVSLACPWAHRTLIMRMLKGLEAKISVSVAHWLMLEHGWTFADGPGVVPDTVNHAKFLHEIYTADARGRADLAGRSGLSACRDRARAPEGGRRKARQGRFYQPLGRAGGAHGPRDAGSRADPGAGRRRAGADEQIGGLNSLAPRGQATVAAQKPPLLYGGLILLAQGPIYVRRRHDRPPHRASGADCGH